MKKSEILQIFKKYGIDNINQYDLTKLIQMLKKDRDDLIVKSDNGLTVKNIPVTFMSPEVMKVLAQLETKNLNDDLSDKFLLNEYKKFVKKNEDTNEIQDIVYTFNRFLNDGKYDTIIKKYGKAKAMKYKKMKAKLGNSDDYMIKMVKGEPKKVKKSAKQKQADKAKSRKMKGKKRPKMTQAAKNKAKKTRNKMKENEILNRIEKLKSLLSESELKQYEKKLKYFKNDETKKSDDYDNLIDTEFKKIDETLNIANSNNPDVNAMTKTKINEQRKSSTLPLDDGYDNTINKIKRRFSFGNGKPKPFDVNSIPDLGIQLYKEIAADNKNEYVKFNEDNINIDFDDIYDTENDEKLYEDMISNRNKKRKRHINVVDTTDYDLDYQIDEDDEIDDLIDNSFNF